MESQGDKHMHILMTTFVPGTRRPLLHDPHPHWNYADSLKTVYANFPVLAKLLQSQGGYSPALGAAYEWLRDCESTTGGQQYFLAKAGWGAFQGGHRQDDLLDLYVQVRNEKEGLRTELDEVKKKHEAEAEVWKMEVDQTNRVKDEQVKERAKAEQQRDTLQRKLSESKSAIKRLGKTNSVDEEKLERARVADPQTLLDKGEGSHQGLQREGPQTRLKRKQDEERRERRREGSRRKEKIALRSSAEGAETRAQRKEAGNGNNESGTGRERNGTRAERNEAGNGPSANGEQGRVKRSRRGVSPGPRGIPRKSPGPKGIPRLVGNEYFPRDIRNPDTLPVRTAYEPDKPLVLYKPEGTKAMLLEGEVVVCHQAHAGPDVTRGRYLTHYDGEYRKRCLDCKAQLSQNKRDRVFVPVISKGSKLKAVYVRDEEMETEETAKSKGRQGKRGDRTTLPIESYRLLSRLVPMLQKLLPCKST